MPPRFCPRIFAPASPVTRAAGDSPAHNARPRRSPRNARSNNPYLYEINYFIQLCLHEKRGFCKFNLRFCEKISKLPVKNDQFKQFKQSTAHRQSTTGQVKNRPALSENQTSAGREKSAAPDQRATLVQFGHVHFSIWSLAAQSDKVALWICTLAAPGEPHNDAPGTTEPSGGTTENHTTMAGNCREPHDYGGELHKSGWELYKNLQSENRRDIIGNKWKATGWGAAQTLPSLSVG